MSTTSEELQDHLDHCGHCHAAMKVWVDEHMTDPLFREHRKRCAVCREQRHGELRCENPEHIADACLPDLLTEGRRRMERTMFRLRFLTALGRQIGRCRRGLVS